MRSFLFVARIIFAWVLVLVVVMFFWRALTGRDPPDIFGLVIIVTMLVVIVKAVSHVRRVGNIAERVDSSTLANRHHRRIEIPFTGGE
jgi:MFS superfamily sulfate permease-like transporter